MVAVRTSRVLPIIPRVADVEDRPVILAIYVDAVEGLIRLILAGMAGRNTREIKSGLPSPVNVSRLGKLLEKYHDREFIINGFSLGFRINFMGPPVCLVGNNSASTVENPKAVDDKLSKELALGRLAGPFSAPPVSVYKISPLSIVPKQEEGKFRLIHNLSFTNDHRAVNFNPICPWGDNILSLTGSNTSSVFYR